MVQSGCHIIKFALVFQWKSYKNDRIYIRSLFCNTHKLYFGFLQKIFLPEKISAGVCCDTQFRENHDSGSLCFHLTDHFDNFSCIEFTVCYLHIRRSCRYFDKPVLHIPASPLFALSEDFFEFFYTECIIGVTEMAVQFYFLAFLDHLI